MTAHPLKVLIVFGTRPEAIKLAPVVLKLQELAKTQQVRPVICVTAQHREMLDQVLELFHIAPHYDLNIMQHRQTLAGLTSAVLVKLDGIIKAEKPDWLIVQGDTTTVAAAALAAFYRKTRVGHVEAGLRTFDKFQPFPEEINRRLASVVADLHFAPTLVARENLLREGITADRVLVTGNPVIDALHMIAEKYPDRPPGQLEAIPKNRRIILVTAHRRESFGKPLEEICSALSKLARLHQGDIQIVYPVHMNPNVQEVAYKQLSHLSNISLLPPLDYLSLVHLIKNCYLVLTDSGGIQEEAPAFGKPILVLRDKTERPEGIMAGTARLVGTRCDRIVEESERLLNNSGAYEAMAQAVNPYGDGHAAEKIVNAIMDFHL